MEWQDSDRARTQQPFGKPSFVCLITVCFEVRELPEPSVHHSGRSSSDEKTPFVLDDERDKAAGC
jgi:hypothetical protein